MKKWKSLLAMALCFAILIPVIMQNSICVREEESAENDGSTLVKCVKLFSADGNREITTGSVLGFGDTFLIRYYFVDLYPRDFEGNITNFVPNVVYSLPDVPKEIQSADGANLDWSCRLEDGVTPLGEASYQNQLTGNMKMTFAEELAESDCITGAYLQLSVKLNQEQCGSALEKQISLPGVEPTTITIGLTDNQPTAPEMQKTGAYNESTKQIDWG